MSVIKIIIDTLFPVRCLGCGTYETWICDHCALRLLQQGEYSGKPLPYKKYLVCVCTVANYHDTLAVRIVGALKYQMAYAAAKRIGQVMAARLAQHMTLYSGVYFDAIVPVPLARRRERWRGFNQSALLASSIGQEFSRPVINVLRRSRFTDTQTELNLAKRRQNVFGAFSVINADAVRGKRILLVDDVITTGATMDECGRVLLRVGAREVWAIAFARG